MGCDGTAEVEDAPAGAAFSILERIEWAATVEYAAGVLLAISLSVSSNGSNGLRHNTFIRRSPRRKSFSILERIEWAATVFKKLEEVIKDIFQYPRTDRMGCDTRHRW